MPSYSKILLFTQLFLPEEESHHMEPPDEQILRRKITLNMVPEESEPPEPSSE